MTSVMSKNFANINYGKACICEHCRLFQNEIISYFPFKIQNYVLQNMGCYSFKLYLFFTLRGSIRSAHTMLFPCIYSCLEAHQLNKRPQTRYHHAVHQAIRSLLIAVINEPDEINSTLEARKWRWEQATALPISPAIFPIKAMRQRKMRRGVHYTIRCTPQKTMLMIITEEQTFHDE